MSIDNLLDLRMEAWKLIHYASFLEGHNRVLDQALRNFTDACSKYALTNSMVYGFIGHRGIESQSSYNTVSSMPVPKSVQEAYDRLWELVLGKTNTRTNVP